MDSRITDIWFKTSLDLETLGRLLGLIDPDFDYENVFEWIIGVFEGVKLNVSRTHLIPTQKAFTHISLERDAGPKKTFDEVLQEALGRRLLSLGISPVFMGQSTLDTEDRFKIIQTIREM